LERNFWGLESWSPQQFGNHLLNIVKIMKTKNDEKLIAVIGATGQPGRGVVRALPAGDQLKVRKNPAITAQVPPGRTVGRAN
jgi:hypothetical protein